MRHVLVGFLLISLVFSLAAEERIDIQSSLISTSTTSIVVGGSITSSKAKVSLRLSVDGANSGANFPASIDVDSLQPTWRIATALSGSTTPTTYTVGTHTIAISMVEFGTVTPILATASAVVTVETARSHIWLGKTSFPNGDFFRKDDTQIDYFLFNTDQTIAADATVEPTSAPPNIKRLTVTLLQSLDAVNERLATSLPASAAYTVSGNTAGSKQISIVATATQSGSVVSGWLSSIAYRYDNSSNPKVGTRRVAFQVTDNVGISSDVSYADIEVKSGLPIVALTGTENGVLPLQDYKEGVGAQVIVPNASVFNQSPVYRYGFRPVPDGSHYLSPSQMYRIDSFGGISFIDGIQVLDRIEVTLSNPDNPNALLDPTTEFLNFTAVPAPGLFSIYDFPGNYLFYDGYYDGGDIELPVGTGLGYSLFNQSTTSIGSNRIYKVSSDPIPQRPAFFAEQAGKAPAELSAFVAILRSLTYTNTSNNLTANGNRRLITVKATNTSTTNLIGGAESAVTASAQLELRLIPKNKMPNFSVATGFFEMNQTNPLNNSPLTLSGLSVSDVDGNGGQEWLTLTVSSGQLAFTVPPASPGSATLSPDGRTLLVKGTVNGNSGSLQSFLSAAGNLRFSPVLGSDEDVTVTVSLDDRGNSSSGTPDPKVLSSSFTIYVDKINQPPVIDVPTTRIAEENTDRIFSGIGVNDVDLAASPSNPLLVRLSSQQGQISLASTLGLDFTGPQPDNEGSGIGDGSGDTVMQFRGLLGDISNATRTITYRANQNYYGLDTITIAVNDLGGVGFRPSGYNVPSNVQASSVSGSPAWITTNQFDVVVQFVNAAPQVAIVPKTIPIGSSAVLQGGDYTQSVNYPPGTIVAPVLRLPNSYSQVSPMNSGTSQIVGSNLVATDIETKQATGLTYTINLPVTQGVLRLARPSVAVEDLIAGSTFTQDDLNKGYVSYAHNGALSGNDGFVFTVTDDNATTCPANAPSGQVNGSTSQQIFNLNIDRTQPIAIFNGSTVATFQEPVAPAAAVPVLLDNDPLTRVVNATDTTNFVTVGNTGRLTATVVIPSQAGVNPGTASSDPLDTLTIRDQPPIGFTGTQLFYNGSPIGSYAGGQGTPLVVTLSSALPISVAAVSELLRHIEYSNPGANPSASQRIVTVTVLNGAGQSSMVASKAVNVVPYNDAPVITPPARPLVLVPGLTLGATVQATDPDGVLSYALSGSPPTRGLVTVDAATGAYTYTPAPNAFGLGGALTDQFEITATDPGILTDPVSKSATQLYQVRITDLGASAPVFTSNPPLETVLGRVLTYAPQVNASSLPGGGNLVFSLVNAPAINPGLGFDPATGTITWPANWTTTPAPTADSYQQFGLLVVDQFTDVAAYQPILLKVLLTPQGSN